jgi:hypothetical protein
VTVGIDQDISKYVFTGLKPPFFLHVGIKVQIVDRVMTTDLIESPYFIE